MAEWRFATGWSERELRDRLKGLRELGCNFAVPLAGRDVLLEIKALGLHYLCGVRIAELRSEEGDGRSIFAFRVVTLEGHLERGTELFRLEKDHATGEVGFQIRAVWRRGQFPNWWSRAGFSAVGPVYRRAWRRLAVARLGGMVADNRPRAK